MRRNTNDSFLIFSTHFDSTVASATDLFEQKVEFPRVRKEFPRLKGKKINQDKENTIRVCLVVYLYVIL